MPRNTVRHLLVSLAVLASGADAWTQAPSSALRYYSGARTRNIQVIDTARNVVHVWRTQHFSKAMDLESDGTLVRGIYDPGNGPASTIGGAAGGAQKLAFDGTMLWDFRINSGGLLNHHDIEPLPNGNVLLIVWEQVTAAEAIAQGRDPALLATPFFLPDKIVEVQPTGPTTGTIVWEWRIWDHLVQDFDNTKANFGVVGNHPELLDINFPRVAEATGQLNHVNSVDYDPIHDWILLSSPKQNEIWIIDHSTTTAKAAGHTGGRWGKGGDLLWRWGNPRAYRAGPPGQLTGQHSAQFIPSGYPGEGNVTVFNNHFGGGRSAVFELVLPLDPYGNFILTPGSPYGPVAPTWTYTASGFFSAIQSSAQRLPNGNTLILSSEQDWIFEVTSAGQIVWGLQPGQGAIFHVRFTTRSLWADTTTLSAAQGGSVDFNLLRGSTAAGNLYLLLCSGSGTSPGFPLFGVHVPLNPDLWFQVSATFPNAAPIFVNTMGPLNLLGQATARFTLPAGLPGGYNLDFAYLLFDVAPLTLTDASNPVPVQVF